MSRNIDCIAIEEFVASQVNPKRLAHCLSCAATLQSLLDRFPYAIASEPDGQVAGLVVGMWHDVARGWTDAQLVAYCREHGLQAEPEELANPMLLHGLVAASLMEQQIPVAPQSWRDAVRWHTLGSVCMGPLGLAMYIVDYLEPLRTHLTPAVRHELFSLPTMELMARKIMDMQRPYLQKSGITEAAVSMKLYQYLVSGGKM